MKKKLTSFILLAVTVIFVVMGIFIPKSIERNHLTYNYEKKFVGFDDKFVVTVTSGKQQSINSVELYFENKFGDDLELVVQGDKITETKDAKFYIYSFEVIIYDGTVDGMISTVDGVKLKTSKGTVDVEYDFTDSKASGLPIRIVCFIVAGISLIIAILIFFLNNHTSNLEPRYEEFAPKEQTEDNPFGSILSSISETLEEMGNNEEKPKKTFAVCEYCGTENDIHSKKCESCGAKISRK